MNRILMLSFLLAGCGSPAIISSTPRMVTVGNVWGGGTAQANELAEQECQKTARHAVFVPDNVRDGNATFECKE